MPCASRIGSSPCCARTPVTSASEKARCAGMLNKAGRVRSHMGKHRLHQWIGLRRADVEPQPLMRYAIQTPSLYSHVHEHAGGKDIRRRQYTQAGRQNFNAVQAEERARSIT